MRSPFLVAAASNFGSPTPPEAQIATKYPLIVVPMAAGSVPSPIKGRKPSSPAAPPFVSAPLPPASIPAAEPPAARFSTERFIIP